jgi:hypothetical protein
MTTTVVGSYMIPLISNWASGDPAPVAVAWPGGDGYVIYQGTVGSATLTLKFAGPEDITHDPIEHDIVIGSAISAAGISTFSAPAGSILPVMGGTGGSALYAALYRKPSEVP